MTAKSGQTVVTTAGTAVALGTGEVRCGVLVKALDTNTGVVAVGNDGADDVTVSNGLRLAAGGEIVFHLVRFLQNLRVDAAVNGEGVSWILLSV